MEPEITVPPVPGMQARTAVLVCTMLGIGALCGVFVYRALQERAAAGTGASVAYGATTAPVSAPVPARDYLMNPEPSVDIRKMIDDAYGEDPQQVQYLADNGPAAAQVPAKGPGADGGGWM
jgi:hypothetical protein